MNRYGFLSCFFITNSEIGFVHQKKQRMQKRMNGTKKMDKRKWKKKQMQQPPQRGKQDEEKEDELVGVIISSPLMRMQCLILIV